MTEHQAVTKLIKDPYHCEHTTIELRERIHSNQVTHYVDQCVRCGAQLKSHKRDSTIVAQAKFNGGIAKFDAGLSDVFFAQANRLRKKERATHRAEWDIWYAEYLNSPRWQAKRSEVMRRDKFTCQGCRGRATLVHHLTYANVGDELLFQLIALCDDCHDRVHEAGK
jgi:5-methylcytosine-specific restriction endonuclease McrA